MVFLHHCSENDLNYFPLLRNPTCLNACLSLSCVDAFVMDPQILQLNVISDFGSRLFSDCYLPPIADGNLRLLKERDGKG